MITINNTGAKKKEFSVMFEGKKVGKIIAVGAGWQYFPNGSKVGGGIFTMLNDCVKSLES